MISHLPNSACEDMLGWSSGMLPKKNLHNVNSIRDP